MHRILPRQGTRSLLTALERYPVVFVNGPRQAGKSTLVESIAGGEFPARYVTLDNPTQLAAASESPTSFLAYRSERLIIDEVQLAPELFRAIKERVDRVRHDDPDHANGHFLLTGSADIMAIRGLASALVGRMAVRTLLPFSTREARGRAGSFIERIFTSDFAGSFDDETDLVDAIRCGTYPAIYDADERTRGMWFDDYVMTILQRDIRTIAEIEKISVLPRLLRYLAAQAGTLVNDSSLGRDLGLNAVTAKRYRSLFHALFLTIDIVPWFRNIGKRLVKSPKSYLLDTSLLCHLLGHSVEELRATRPDLFGHVLENYVASEILKQRSFGDGRYELLHFRTSSGREVDFVLERPDGRLAAVEVKAADHVTARDFDGIRTLAESTGDDLVVGIVLYTGREVVPFGNRLMAVPVEALWS